MEEAVKQLTAQVFTRPDWPYPLVWLNGYTCHVPLPREGHLSILVEGGTSIATSGRVSHLEVCQLLSSGSQVIYPVGLNGCEFSVIASPPKSLAKGTNLLGGKPIYLKVDMLQSIMEGPKVKVPSPGSQSSLLSPSPVRTPLPKVEGEVSMTMEVRELLSQVGLDMSGHASGNSTPKRIEPIVLVTPLPTKLEDFPWPVDTSSQVSAPDNADMEDASLEEIPTVSPPTAETAGPNSGTPSDAAHLWEEANKALKELLLIKTSIDAHQHKLVWELGMALCQNNSKAAESIKEAKTLCPTAIREMEAWGASQAGSLQQLHAKP